MSRCPQPDPGYAEACSAQTLCSRRGFLRALLPELAAVPDARWLAALEPLGDAERLRAARAHPQLMEALSEVLSRVTPLRRGKDARASRASRLAAEELLASGPAPAPAPAPSLAALDQALAKASEAVLRAPAPEDEDEDTTLALALWTRSAVLLARERARRAAGWGGAPGEGGARAALADLGLALRAHLPARMRAHYYWRAGQCYQECGEGTRAKVSMELALRLLKDDAERAQLRKQLDQLDVPPAPLAPPAPPAPPASPTEITLTGGAAPNTPSLSNLLEIVEEEGKGRFAAARAGVRPGDVLLREEPYAACLLPERRGTHCLHCFTRLSRCSAEAPLWCAGCAGAAFCSARCRRRAAYHRHECAFQELFIGSGMSILSHIALRMVTQLGLRAALAVHARYVAAPAPTPAPAPPLHTDIDGGRRAKIKSRKERLNRNKKGIKTEVDKEEDKQDKDKGQKKDEDEDEDDNLEQRTAQVYQLCTHSEQRTGRDYLQRLLVAAFLADCLHKGGLFEGCAPQHLEDSRWAITELIIRNLQLLQFNAHEVFETLRAGGAGGEGGAGGHLFRGARALHVAVAIYPTGALFNHDCFPATARFFVGRSLVLAATRPLAAGSAAGECYGPAAALRGPAARRRALAARYWFTCGCDACARPQLWPTLADCGDQTPPLRCVKESCSGVLVESRGAGGAAGDAGDPGDGGVGGGARCDACGAEVAAGEVARRRDIIDDCHALFQEGARLMDAQRVPAAVRVLRGALLRFHGAAAAPRRHAYLAHEALRAALATAGNTHFVSAAAAAAADQHEDDAPTPDQTI